MNYVKGNSREQIKILCIDELVSRDSFARIIDDFVDNMDTSYFEKSQLNHTGRPPYNPKDMLKLYIYGIENEISSSRKLERECSRNIELMWLMNELVPENKTISNFRKDNAENLVRFFGEFCCVLKENGYIDGKIMALDGTKIRANNSRKNNYTLKKINLRLMEIEAKMTEYLSDLSLNDDIEEKIESMNKKKEKYEALKTEMESKGVKEISTTDKDARLMKANNQGTDVSYNVQSVVDSKYKLIAGMEVVCSASDNGLLGRVMPRIKEELGLEETTVLADTGYYKAKDFDVCENRGIYPIVAKQKERAGDLIKIDEFEYDAKEDVYICPNNKKLTRKGIVSEYYYRYMNASGCKKCPQKAKCTTGGWREIKRNIWKESADRNDRRLSENKGLYKQRQALAEHPFGTMKRAMGVRQFLTRGKTNVAAEVALIFLCYNLKRLRKIMTQNPIMNGAFPRLRAV